MIHKFIKKNVFFTTMTYFSYNILNVNSLECVYDFSVDYSTISNDKIQDIHSYLMKKNGTV